MKEHNSFEMGSTVRQRCTLVEHSSKAPCLEPCTSIMRSQDSNLSAAAVPEGKFRLSPNIGDAAGPQLALALQQLPCGLRRLLLAQLKASGPSFSGRGDPTAA